MRCLQFHRFLLMLISWWLVGCSGHPGGNSAPLGLGSPQTADSTILLDSLQAARSSLFTKLQLLAGAPDSSICDVDDPTGKDPILYQIAHAMNESQRAFCQDFILGTLTTLPQQYLPSDPTPLTLSYAPIFVNDQGLVLQVVAVTQPQMDDPIEFAVTTLQNYSPTLMEATLAHEFGHKLDFATYGGKVTDAPATGPFLGQEGGRHFLDAVGAAVALYHAGNANLGSGPSPSPGASPTPSPIPSQAFSNSQVFDASATFTAPPKVRKIMVEVWGAGGGGAGGTFNASCGRGGCATGGGGGGSGGYCLVLLNVTPGANYSVTVGNAGASGGTGINGSGGGPSSFDVLATATGGNGAEYRKQGANTGGTPGSGGACTLSLGTQAQSRPGISGQFGGIADQNAGATGGAGGSGITGVNQPAHSGAGGTGGEVYNLQAYEGNPGAPGRVTVWW